MAGSDNHPTVRVNVHQLHCLAVWCACLPVPYIGTPSLAGRAGEDEPKAVDTAAAADSGDGRRGLISIVCGGLCTRVLCRILITDTGIFVWARLYYYFSSVHQVIFSCLGRY